MAASEHDADKDNYYFLSDSDREKYIDGLICGVEVLLKQANYSYEELMRVAAKYIVAFNMANEERKTGVEIHEERIKKSHSDRESLKAKDKEVKESLKVGMVNGVNQQKKHKVNRVQLVEPLNINH